LNNFGVVTRFDLEVFEQGPLWGGVIIYSNASDEELLTTLAAFKDPEAFDPDAMITSGFIYYAADNSFTANAAMYHARPERVNGSTLEAFAKIQPQLYNSMRTGSPGSFAGEKLAAIPKSY
jgi:hypothetical protein